MVPPHLPHLPHLPHPPHPLRKSIQDEVPVDHMPLLENRRVIRSESQAYGNTPTPPRIPLGIILRRNPRGRTMSMGPVLATALRGGPWIGTTLKTIII